MNAESVILITKDALNRDYLPAYGNNIWNTPNLDELARKGTTFTNYYTAAPSTAMSNMSMFTGKYAHESELSRYYTSHIRYKGDTLFDTAFKNGYQCHIIWDEAWKTSFHMEEKYYCYGEHTQIHYLQGFRQGVGAHYIHNDFLKRNDEKTENVYRILQDIMQLIVGNSKEKIFLWLHVPHVINGRTGYGQDIDAFDHIIGIMRNYFSDENIFVSADHGNMNGKKGKIGYGFDVYNPAILIPLITPKICEKTICTDLICNVDLKDIIFNRTYPKRNVVYSDSAFYAQPYRKLAIISGHYKYIYNKSDKTEELYDLSFDPYEETNLISDFIYDPDRHVNTPLRELYYYPRWSEMEDVRSFFRKEKAKIWKTGSMKEEIIPNLKYWFQKTIYYKIRKWVDLVRVKDGTSK